MTAKQKKPQNFVAKYSRQINKNSRHRNKKTDFTRNQKHRQKEMEFSND